MAKLSQPLMLRALPRPGRPMKERRVRRSKSAVDALKLAMNQSAERAQCDAVVIADDDGMVVCQSTTCLELEMLAAVAPIVARGEARATVKRRGEPRELSVHSLTLLGEVLHVAVLGGEARARTRELATVVSATRRILAA